MIKLSDIQTISEHCIRLLSTTEELRRNEITKDAYKYAEQLFPSLRKLFIASMMHDKRLICISGLQGAGKTTLMKNFYGINDEFMNVSLGRGERVPVLITEGDVSETHIHAIAVQKNATGQYSEMDIILQNDEIIRATKGEDPTIMYIEITVPYKHFYNKGVSFMLLPGFEKKNEYWNNLIEFSINSSDAAVFVFNEESFSHEENEDYLRIIETKFGSNVVYAISGSDNSHDGNVQVKDTCMRVLKVEDPDRVVCVGQYNDAAMNNAWITAFKTALDKYALFETQVTQKTSSYIYDELLIIQDTLYTILGILNEGDTIESTDYHNHKLLQSYDVEISKQRKVLANHITEEFEVAKSQSVNSIANQLDAKPWYKNLKKTFFGADIKEQYIETQEMIKSSLYNGDICLPNLFLGKAIRKSVQILDNPQSNNPNALGLLVDTEEKDGKTVLQIESEDTKAAVNDVCALIQIPNKNIERYSIQSSNPRRVLKAVSEIATYYYGFESYNDLAGKTAGLAYYEPAHSELTGEVIVKGAESTKQFAVGLAGVMGVDILGDGSLNLVSQIAESCHIAFPYAGALAVLMVAGGAVTAVIKDLNRMQRADFESAKMTIHSIYDNIQREALEQFDDFTNKVRERIEDNLTDLSGGNKTILTIYNAKVELNNLLDLLKNITEEYLAQSHDIGTYFSR